MVRVLDKPEIELEIITVKRFNQWICCYSCHEAFHVGDNKIKWRLLIDGVGFSYWNQQCTGCAKKTINAYTELFASNTVMNTLIDRLPLQQHE